MTSKEGVLGRGRIISNTHGLEGDRVTTGLERERERRGEDNEED